MQHEDISASAAAIATELGRAVKIPVLIAPQTLGVHRALAVGTLTNRTKLVKDAHGVASASERELKGRPRPRAGPATVLRNTVDDAVIAREKPCCRISPVVLPASESM